MNKYCVFIHAFVPDKIILAFLFLGMRCLHIHNRPELKQLRKNLRNNSTSAEATLWNKLKKNQLNGRKFMRQHSIGNYIYCPEEKLVIELDGEAHFWQDGIQYDHQRALYLNNMDIHIIRFENKWVFEDIDYVLNEIKKHFK
jgi:very-short-patch-repair endonuclease